MPERTSYHLIDGIRFDRIVRFPRILGAVTGAMQPPRLAVALLMVVLVTAIGRTWDGFVEPQVPPQGLLAETAAPAAADLATARAALAGLGMNDVLQADDPAEALRERVRAARIAGADVEPRRVAEAAAAIAAVRPRGPFAATVHEVRSAVVDIVRGMFTPSPAAVVAAADRLFVRTPAALGRTHPWFAVVFGLTLVLVAAIGGGALARMTACERALAERISVREALFYGLRNWVQTAAALVLAPLIAGALGGVIALLGLTLAPWVDLLGGLLYGLALALGFVIAFLMLGYALSLPLIVPAVAIEDCDPVDAQQRGFAYLLRRPLHLLGYGAWALVGLALGYVVIAALAAATINVTAHLAGQFIDAPALAAAGNVGPFALEPSPGAAAWPTWHDAWAGGLIGFWHRLVLNLVAAWVVAYLFSASTEIYLLMRQACDGQDAEEIAPAEPAGE